MGACLGERRRHRDPVGDASREPRIQVHTDESSSAPAVDGVRAHASGHRRDRSAWGTRGDSRGGDPCRAVSFDGAVGRSREWDAECVGIPNPPCLILLVVRFSRGRPGRPGSDGERGPVGQACQASLPCCCGATPTARPPPVHGWLSCSRHLAPPPGGRRSAGRRRLGRRTVSTRCRAQRRRPVHRFRQGCTRPRRW